MSIATLDRYYRLMWRQMSGQVSGVWKQMQWRGVGENREIEIMMNIVGKARRGDAEIQKQRGRGNGEQRRYVMQEGNINGKSKEVNGNS